MEENKSYFGEIGHALKTLATGMGVTWKEYFKDFFTNKSTEQYPENRKTTLHVAKRHRGRLVFKRNEDGSYKCTACTLCEKSCPNGTIKIVSHMQEDPETGKKKKVNRASICATFGVKMMEEMTTEQFKECMSRFRGLPDQE